MTTILMKMIYGLNQWRDIIDIWIIYMHRRLINPQLYKSGRDYQLKHAEQLFKEWFLIFDYWFGIKRKISSIEEFNIIADLMGY